MIRRADRWRRGSQVITTMWIMMLMMTRVRRMVSLVTNNVLLQRLWRHTVRAVGLGGRGGRGGGTVGRFLRRSDARFMSASLSLLRLMRGVEILGLFLLAFLVRSPFVLEPCVEGLGRPFVGRGARNEAGKHEVVSHIG